MQRPTKIFIAVILTLGIAGGAAAVGKHRFGSPERKAKHMVNYITEALDLDASQQQALLVLKEQLIQSHTSIKSDMVNLHNDVNSLFVADAFNRTQALDLINARTAQINSLAPDLVNSVGDFLDSLNPAQKAQVSEFLAHRHQRQRIYRY